MTYGKDSYGLGLYGGTISLFQVESAKAINPYAVLLTFSAQPDFSDPETLNPANYYIDVVGPGTPIGVPYAVSGGPELNTVILATPQQEYALYEVTVGPNVVSDTGTPIDPLANSATFTGTVVPEEGKILGFRAKAIRQDGINLVFANPMLVNSDFTNPLNYTVRDMTGAIVPVLSVTPNLPSNATRAVLTLGVPMRPTVAHEVKISALIKTASGLDVIPDTDVTVWVPRRLVTKVPFSVFTKEVRAASDLDVDLAETLTMQESLSSTLVPFRFGPPQGNPDSLLEALELYEGLEVSGSDSPQVDHSVSLVDNVRELEKLSFTKRPDYREAIEASLSETLSIREALEVLPKPKSGVLDPNLSKLFGDPDGLVFFSPSLITGGAPTSSIQVDKVETCTRAYDSYKFPETKDPQPFFLHGLGLVPTPNASLLNSAVLFTNFYRLNEATHKIHNRPEDTVPVPSDVGVTMVLTETWPPNRVALLNNPGWALFDGVAAPPYDFILADNLSPFPPPVVAPKQYFVNPSEVLVAVESLAPVMGTSASVSESVVLDEVYDLTPGENVVQVNVFESLAVSDLVSTHIGINLSETLTHSESVNVST